MFFDFILMRLIDKLSTPNNGLLTARAGAGAGALELPSERHSAAQRRAGICTRILSEDLHDEESRISAARGSLHI